MNWCIALTGDRSESISGRQADEMECDSLPGQTLFTMYSLDGWMSFLHYNMLNSHDTEAFDKFLKKKLQWLSGYPSKE